MTEQEWAALAVELDHAFVGDFGADPAQEAVFVKHLGGLPYDVVAAAIALLVEDGQVHLPRVGELRAAVQRVTQASVAPFSSVWATFERSVQRHVRLGDRDRDAAVVRDVLEACGEGPARWVAARGVRTLAHEPVNGEHAGAVRHRLERECAEYVDQAREDGRVGRAIASVKRAEVTAGDGLRRVDAAALGLLPEGS